MNALFNTNRENPKEGTKVRFIFKENYKHLSRTGLFDDNSEGKTNICYIIPPVDLTYLVTKCLGSSSNVLLFLEDIEELKQDPTISLCKENIESIWSDKLMTRKEFKYFHSTYTIMYNRIIEICKNRTKKKKST